MRKTPVICSFLMGFSLSAMIVGCEPSKAPATKAPVLPARPGSTTGGGAKVPPSPSKGTAETPKAAEPAPKTEETPAAPDAPKDGDASKDSEAPKN